MFFKLFGKHLFSIFFLLKQGNLIKSPILGASLLVLISIKSPILGAPLLVLILIKLPILGTPQLVFILIKSPIFGALL